MSSVLDQIDQAAGEHGLNLRKAAPRGPEHLLLELARADGTTVAGQWFADRKRASRVAKATRECTGGQADVQVVGSSGVLLQPQGADRRLPALHRLATEGDATLVAHRPERRGVVRRFHDHGETTYTKTVRPDRLTALLTTAREQVAGVSLPRVTATDTSAGTVTSTALPGPSLHELLGDVDVSTRHVVAAAHAVGEAVARLHASTPPEAGPWHDATEELKVTQRWLGQARLHGLLDPSGPSVGRAVATARRLLAGSPCGPARLHRDLHDKQLLVAEDGTVGMIDFDLSAVGEPALDLANLLVHLELRAVQGVCAPERAAACAEAVIVGYSPDEDVWRRVPAYALSARLRLAAVYSFRPHATDIAAALLTGPPISPLIGPLNDPEEHA